MEEEKRQHTEQLCKIRRSSITTFDYIMYLRRGRCVRACERESVCMCVCVWEKERMCLYHCECDLKSEGEKNYILKCVSGLSVFMCMRVFE